MIIKRHIFHAILKWKENNFYSKSQTQIFKGVHSENLLLNTGVTQQKCSELSSENPTINTIQVSMVMLATQRLCSDSTQMIHNCKQYKHFCKSLKKKLYLFPIKIMGQNSVQNQAATNLSKHAQHWHCKYNQTQADIPPTRLYHGNLRVITFNASL